MKLTKPYAILFKEYNARILKGPDALSWKGDKNVLFEPDLSHLSKVPTHYWKRSGNKIIEMTDDEKRKRDQVYEIKEENVSNLPGIRQQVDLFWRGFVFGALCTSLVTFIIVFITRMF